ncbi:pancreatic lipase-related protein 2 [Halyomorpha halys]|uniref:pancreatic lipase-related protein 2 n=1 Tax=Halyomorpha halys TaxID=286706 RepID=UPI0006D51ED8|nr:pancreatic lipase-related protein 2-like [Halyomorpha halys]
MANKVNIRYLAVILLLNWASVVNCFPQGKRKCGGEECTRASKSLPLGQGNSLNEVKFYLYNKNIIDGSDGYSVYGSTEIETVFKQFEAKNKTKIIIHGWLDSRKSSINGLIKDAYLKNHGYNVIITDWSGAGSMIPVYPVARSMIENVAFQLAMLIDNLNFSFNQRPEDVHLIGHSLGAHIAGMTGARMETGYIGRVTGLDPASPLFKIDKPDERISNSSALFVDVIHTSGLFLGTTYQMGHADFFPNNGKWVQPGCNLDIDGVCSHARAYLYYAESIEYPFGYQSTPCFSWLEYVKNKCEEKETIEMGAFVPTSARGLYYLKTNSEPPFFQL